MENKQDSFFLLERRFEELKERDEKRDKEVFERIIQEWKLNK